MIGETELTLDLLAGSNLTQIVVTGGLLQAGWDLYSKIDDPTSITDRLAKYQEVIILMNE